MKKNPKYRKKKIIVNQEKDKWVWCYLFKEKGEMQKAYNLASPKDRGHDKVEGVAINRSYQKSKQTGYVFLHTGRCGAGVVSHEFMHSVLWAHKHRYWKEQYPITIKNMKEEEKILHNLTVAVAQFYKFYWDIVDNKKL